MHSANQLWVFVYAVTKMWIIKVTSSTYIQDQESLSMSGYTAIRFRTPNIVVPMC